MKPPFKSMLTSILARGVLLLLATFGSMAIAPDAAAQQTQASSSEGHAICGAMDLRTGKYMGACGFSKAKYTGKAVGKCPQGSFFDIGTWSCFTCPRGFNRTGNAVDTPLACSKEVPAQYKRATRVSGHKSCPAGSVKDGRNGGECWSCPAGYGRTMSAVNEWDACGKAFAPARRAEFIDRVCPEGTITDANGSCYTCPQGFRRTAAAVTGHNACFRNELLQAANKEAALTCKAGDHFDFVDGGTCWSCPENSVRSASGVKTNQACEFLTMRWEPAKRTPNGLFGLPGAHEIVAQVIKERTLIDEGITNYISAARLNKTKADELKNKAWKLILTEPEDSAILKAAVYNHVFNVIKRGAKTKPERDMLNYMSVYVQQSRLLVAREMQNVWLSWKRGLEVVRPGMSTGLNPSDIGVRPPQMEDQVSDIMLLAPGAAVVVAYAGLGGALVASTSIAKAVGAVGQAIFPYLVEGMAKTAGTAVTTGSIASTSMMFLAPTMAILAVSVVVASVGTDIALDQIKQESIVTEALAGAKKPVNLARLLLTDNGRTEVLMNWGLMTQESIKPHAAKWAHLMTGAPAPQRGSIADIIAAGIPTNINLPQILLSDGKTVVNATSTTANKSTKWVKIGGKATDVAVGSDGTAYVIGVKKISAKGGFEIFKLAKTDRKWTKIKGAASRIAVMGTQAWVVTLDGQIFSESGPNKWQKIPGPAAQDIGASAKGVWIVDMNNKIHKREGTAWKSVPGFATRIDIDQDGRPWALSRKDTIFVHDNKEKWQKIPGNAIDVAADIPGATVAIGKNGKTFVYNIGKKNWDTISSDNADIAVGAGGGQVWRLTKTNEIYRQE